MGPKAATNPLAKSSSLVNARVATSLDKQIRIQARPGGAIRAAEVKSQHSHISTKETIERNTGIIRTKPILESNASQVIEDIKYSGHALDRMHERGIFPSVVESVINNIQPIIGKEANTLVYYDLTNNLTIIQNSITKQIITLTKGIIKQ